MKDQAIYAWSFLMEKFLSIILQRKMGSFANPVDG